MYDIEAYRDNIIWTYFVPYIVRYYYFKIPFERVVRCSSPSLPLPTPGLLVCHTALHESITISYNTQMLTLPLA